MYRIQKTIAFRVLIVVMILIYCFAKSSAQDITQFPMVLVVKRQMIKPWNIDSNRTIYMPGNRISVVYSDHNRMCNGELTFVCDSFITIRDKKIKISEIKRISRYRGVEPIIIGGSLIASGILMGAIYEDSFENYQYQNHIQGNEAYNMGIPIGGALIAFLGGCTSVFGIIEAAATKHFTIGKKWKLLPRSLHGNENFDRFLLHK
jgi:hypothetical protein